MLRDRFGGHSFGVLLHLFLVLNISTLPSPAAKSLYSAVAGSQLLYTLPPLAANYPIALLDVFEMNKCTRQ